MTIGVGHPGRNRAARAGLAAAIALAGLRADAAPEAVQGTWGTGAQCARALLQDGGTVHAAPFRIAGGWLRHGATWCALTWFPPQPQDGGSYTGAQALCGEDSAQRHSLAFAYRSGPPETLTLIWNGTLINGPLARCRDGD